MAQLPNLGITSMVRQATGAIGSVFNATEVFTSYIDKVKADQKVDHAIHRAEYAERVIGEAAMRSAERKIELERFADKSPVHSAHLQESLEKYKAVLGIE